MAIIRLLLNTGLRARELRELKTRNIDWTSGRMKVRGKGRKERVLWLAEEDITLIRAWLSKRPSSNQRASSELVFTSLDGQKPLCARWLRKLVKRLAGQAGIDKDVHPHTLRHSFATDLYRQSKNLRLVQKALGHSSVATTEIYTHVCDPELEAAMKDLRNGG
jgi:integrase/recombinase XerD